MKINKSGEAQTRFNFVGGRIDVINMQLRGIIQSAYRVPANQLVNVPGWVNGTRVDIVAKADPKYSVQELQTMLQPLLVERFKLKFHREMRDMDVYVMTRGEQGRPSGAEARKVRDQLRGARAPSRASSLTPPKPGELPACGTVPGGPGHMIFRGFGMGPFVQILGLATRGRQVIDRDRAARAATTSTCSTRPRRCRPRRSRPAAERRRRWPRRSIRTARISFTAMREQLGLKLEGKKMALEVMVVDEIQPPTED